MYLENMTWKRAGECLESSPLVLIPLGSVEQHGPIGPLGTDFLIPDAFARRIEERMPDDVLVLPTVQYGVCPYHMGFPGTIDIGTDALTLVLRRIAEAMMRCGARKFFFLNGHGGNGPALDAAALSIYREGGLAAVADWWSIAGQLNPDWVGGHGMGQEASMMMSIRPGTVDLGTIFRGRVNHLGDSLRNTHLTQVRFGKGTFRIVRDVCDVETSGAFGGPDDPAKASKEWGDEMFATMTEYFCDFLREFQSVPLK